MTINCFNFISFNMTINCFNILILISNSLNLLSISRLVYRFSYHRLSSLVFRPSLSRLHRFAKVQSSREKLLSWCQINRSLFDFVKLDMTSSKLNRVTWELVSFARRLTNLIFHLYNRFNFALLFVVSSFVLYIHQTLSLL